MSVEYAYQESDPGPQPRAPQERGVATEETASTEHQATASAAYSIKRATAGAFEFLIQSGDLPDR